MTKIEKEGLVTLTGGDFDDIMGVICLADTAAGLYLLYTAASTTGVGTVAVGTIGAACLVWTAATQIDW